MFAFCKIFDQGNIRIKVMLHMVYRSVKAAIVILMTNAMLGHKFGVLFHLKNTTLRPYLTFKMVAYHHSSQCRHQLGCACAAFSRRNSPECKCNDQPSRTSTHCLLLVILFFLIHSENLVGANLKKGPFLSADSFSFALQGGL